MGKYTDIKSDFVKNKLKEADWKKDKRYIDNLIDIEQHILGKKRGLGSGYARIYFEDEYPKEFEEIYKELNPKDWKKIQRENKKEAKIEEIEEEKELEFNKSLAQKEKEDWIKAGGK